MKIICVSIFLFLCLHNLFSQVVVSPELESKLSGKTAFKEIKAAVNNYYIEKKSLLSPADTITKKILESERKKWNRWLWYNEGRLMPGGKIANIDSVNRAYNPIIQNNFLNSPASSNGFWSSLGPVDVNFNISNSKGIGRVDRIAFHPTNASIIFAGTPAGGFWKTTNSGVSWTNLTDKIPSTGISGIVISHANPDHIYLLTGDGDSDFGGFLSDFGYIRRSAGVLKSVDGGVNWFHTANLGPANPYTGYKLIQHPTNADIIVAATSEGLYRTTNGGNSWDEVSPISGVRYFDAEFQPSGSRLYVAGNDFIGFVRYTDNINNGSVIWQTPVFDQSGEIGTSDRLAIAVTPVSPGVVYVFGARQESSGGVFKGIHRSTDNGVNFIMNSNTPNAVTENQVLYDFCMAVSSTNANTIYTGCIDIYKSTNAGTTMTQLTEHITGTGFPYVHADIHELAVNPLNANLYVGCDGGIFVSTNGGGSFTDLYASLQATQFYHLAGFEGDVNFLFGGAQDNGTLLCLNSTNVYNVMLRGDGFQTLFDPTNPSILWSVLNKGIIKQVIAGATTDETPSGAPDQYFPSLVIHPTNGSILFAGYDDIFKTSNSGASWVNTGADGSWCMTASPTNGNRYYAAGGDHIYRTDDAGGNWITLTANPGFPSAASFTKITGIAVDPGYSGNVFVSFGGYDGGQKVYMSTNAGNSWTNFSGSLPNIPANCLMVTPDGTVYVGMDHGVFYRKPGMSDWNPYYNNLPRVPVTELVYNAADLRIRAATFGRGIWETSVPPGCVNTLNFSSPLSGIFHYEASQSITGSGTIENGVGTQIYFRAGTEVTLSPGFHAKAQTLFNAYIGPCEGGGVPNRISKDSLDRKKLPRKN